jgi:hypothetical protein
MGRGTLLTPTPRLIWQALSPGAALTLLTVALALFAVLVLFPMVVALAGVPFR